MIERRLFMGHPLVRQPFGQKLDEIMHVLLRAGDKFGESQTRYPFDIRIKILKVGVRKVSAASIELDDMAERRRIPVVEVGSGKLDIAQVRSLEVAKNSLPLEY